MESKFERYVIFVCTKADPTGEKVRVMFERYVILQKNKNLVLHSSGGV